MASAVRCTETTIYVCQHHHDDDEHGRYHSCGCFIDRVLPHGDTDTWHCNCRCGRNAEYSQCTCGNRGSSVLPVYCVLQRLPCDTPPATSLSVLLSADSIFLLWSFSERGNLFGWDIQKSRRRWLLWRRSRTCLFASCRQGLNTFVKLCCIRTLYSLNYMGWPNIFQSLEFCTIFPRQSMVLYSILRQDSPLPKFCHVGLASTTCVEIDFVLQVPHRGHTSRFLVSAPHIPGLPLHIP